MKEITNIHLAKTPFSVEVEAKHALAEYLASIQQRMHAEPEAMREIEARMVELLAERGVTRDGVVTTEDVTALRGQMGEPREFASEAEAGDDDAALRDAAEAALADGAPKQLMRDTDHALIGGVCAGVAAYFGISPLWIRLLAIVSPFMTFGTALLISLLPLVVTTAGESLFYARAGMPLVVRPGVGPVLLVVLLSLLALVVVLLAPIRSATRAPIGTVLAAE